MLKYFENSRARGLFRISPAVFATCIPRQWNEEEQVSVHSCSGVLSAMRISVTWCSPMVARD